MSFFTADQVDQLAAAAIVRCGTLVDFEFDDPKYVWNGAGQLLAGGQLYDGIGSLGKIEGLGQTRTAQSSQVTMTLSGVNQDILSTTLAETDLVQGRIAVVSMQLFDGAWQNIGDPIPIYFGICQQPEITWSPAQGQDGPVRTITLGVENLFFGRSRPPAGRYTDRDQQTRFPGDRFCERVALGVGRPVTWPNFVIPLLLSGVALELMGRFIQGAF